MSHHKNSKIGTSCTLKYFLSEGRFHNTMLYLVNERSLTRAALRQGVDLIAAQTSSYSSGTRKPQPRSVAPTHSGAQPFRVHSKGLSGEFMLHQNTGCAEVRSAYADDFIILPQRLPLSEMSADEAGVGGAERASQSSV